MPAVLRRQPAAPRRPAPRAGLAFSPGAGPAWPGRSRVALAGTPQAVARWQRRISEQPELAVMGLALPAGEAAGPAAELPATPGAVFVPFRLGRDLLTAVGDAAAVAAGRPVLAEVTVSVGRTAAEAGARAETEELFAVAGHPAREGLFGTLEECQAMASALAHAGATELVCYLPRTNDIADVLAQLRAIAKELLRIRADDKHSWDETEANIFTEDFLLERPLLAAIRAPDPVLLLIDEIDRVEVETEALLLEVLSDFQVSIPELGTITARRTPLVFLTSNATRELSDALKRRCLYLYLDFPDPERERQIIELRVPDIRPALARQAARVVHALRALDLQKPPSISETVDWARSLVLLGVADLDPPAIARTLPVLVKNHRDIERASTELDLAGPLNREAPA